MISRRRPRASRELLVAESQTVTFVGAAGDSYPDDDSAAQSACQRRGRQAVCRALQASFIEYHRARSRARPAQVRLSN